MEVEEHELRHTPPMPYLASPFHLSLVMTQPREELQPGPKRIGDPNRLAPVTVAGEVDLNAVSSTQALGRLAAVSCSRVMMFHVLSQRDSLAGVEHMALTEDVGLGSGEGSALVGEERDVVLHPSNLGIAEKNGIQQKSKPSRSA